MNKSITMVALLVVIVMANKAEISLPCTKIDSLFIAAVVKTTSLMVLIAVYFDIVSINANRLTIMRCNNQYQYVVLS